MLRNCHGGRVSAKVEIPVEVELKVAVVVKLQRLQVLVGLSVSSRELVGTDR